ncbi:MAG: hypothetical protein Q9M37_00480 [Desulfonauticus sp.]|nr:hypothetical protein [Desulfonauticus sp.]
MHYDIASKIILSHCKEPFLRYFCNLSVDSALLIDTRPQETTSVRRSDFVLKTILSEGEEILVLIEFLSSWKEHIPLRTLEYRCRHILQEKLPVKTFVFLLTPSRQAKNYYQDEEVDFRFNLIRLYDIPAEDILASGNECLLSFLPLTKGGSKYLEEGESRIYNSSMSREKKADLLTGMAILGGLISEDIPLQLIHRRRDIMIESAAYEIIKQEGIKEGIQQGIQQGLERGIQQGLERGIQQGMYQGMLKAIELGLKLKFGVQGLKIYPEIKKIKDIDLLEAISEAIEAAKDVEEIKKFMS